MRALNNQGRAKVLKQVGFNGNVNSKDEVQAWLSANPSAVTRIQRAINSKPTGQPTYSEGGFVVSEGHNTPDGLAFVVKDAQGNIVSTHVDNKAAAIQKASELNTRAQAEAGPPTAPVLPSPVPTTPTTPDPTPTPTPDPTPTPTPDPTPTPTPDAGGGNTGTGADPNLQADPTITTESVSRMFNPTLPNGGAVQAVSTQEQDNQIIDPNVGNLDAQREAGTATANTATAEATGPNAAGAIGTSTVEQQVKAVADSTTAQQSSQQERIDGAQQTESAVSNLDAASGQSIDLENPAIRKAEDGELISGAFDAQAAADFTEAVQAAQATPSQQTSVAFQLEKLYGDFDAANPPPWAAGGIRVAQERLLARGLGASSMAGQAIVQAALEAALPIAVADAQTASGFEMANLSNRQQVAMLSAQQRAQFIGMEFDQKFQARVLNASRVADIANMNFTAEQQIALENARAANTINLANLSNTQALTMAEAAALSQLDQANLSNRQQAAVQNAANFLQRDMVNLSNRQQTELFNSQARIQSLFSDQAALNATEQFNATTENQVDQFFASLQTTVSQFNATQENAQEQFNTGQSNAQEQFNSSITNQRQQFEAQNQVAINQSNAVWRREIATAATAAVNRTNEINAQNVLDISNTAYNNLWQHYADLLEFAWESAEDALDRDTTIAVAEIAAETADEDRSERSSTGAGQVVGGLIGTLGGAIISSIF